MSEPKSTESLGSGCGSPAQTSTQQGPEMVAVKLEDCSQTLEHNVVVKEEEVMVKEEEGGEDVEEKDNDLDGVNSDSEPSSTSGNHERQQAPTGEHAYPWPQCGESFAHPNNLKKHQRMHTGERPFHCFQCDKSFIKLGGLNRHQRMHTRERPHHADNTVTEETSPGVLNGKFHFKKLPDGTLDKTKVVCTYCGDEMSFHRSTTSLKYHLRAKHSFADVSKDASTERVSSRVHPATLAECSRGKSVNKAKKTIVLNGKFHFKKLPDGSLDKTKVVCTYCSDELSFHRSTTSLNYHIRAKHTVADVSKDASTVTGPSPVRQTTLAGGKPVNNAKTAKLTDAIAKWITMDCRPINIVEDQGLQGIIQIASDDPSYKAPSRGTIVTRIHELYSSEKATKAEQLAQATFIALTGDHWTSVSNDNYLGVTAHLIDDKWQLHSFALGVLKAEERQFAEACARQFVEVAKEWEITDKVTTIGTADISNMIAAARKLPFEHMPCVAHIIQEVITVALSDSGFDGALAKCRKIVGHFKHSPANAAELKVQQASHRQEEESLVQDVPTRWNSTLEMIKRVQHNKDPLKVALAQQKHSVAMLTSAEYDRLANLETLLEPCRYVTELLGGDRYVSCSVVLPAFCHLLRSIEVSEVDPAYVVRFKAAFTEDLNRRKENANLSWLKVATALDPRFKDLRCLPRAEREEVWRQLREMLKDGEAAASQPCGEETEPEPLKKKKKKTALLLMESESDEEEASHTDRSLDRYRAEPRVSVEACPLEWWSAHKGAHGKLALVAQRYLATPASTVPCERLFSSAGHTVQKKRSALSSENVNKLVCLSNWLKSCDTS